MNLLTINIANNGFSTKISLMRFYCVLVDVIPDYRSPTCPNEAQRKSSRTTEKVNKLSLERNVLGNLIGKQWGYGISNLIIYRPK